MRRLKGIKEFSIAYVKDRGTRKSIKPGVEKMRGGEWGGGRAELDHDVARANHGSP